ncbi:hypothetical protein TNCV_5090901, partial [Trichonephila clavipes]
MTESGSNQKISPTERGGGRTPKLRNALSKQSAGGEGKKAKGRDAGRPAAVTQRRRLITHEPQNKMTHWTPCRRTAGIIRKQADGGVLWKVMCVDVVQVR